MARDEVQLRVRVTGRHPQFFRKMIRRPERPLPAGGAVRVRDRTGALVGTAFYNPRCELALRMLAREDLADVAAHLAARLDDAAELRERVLRLPEHTDAYRVVHGEGDGLPGLIIDRLGPALVAQVFCLGIHRELEPLGEHLRRRYPRAQLMLTVDEVAARREGIPRPPPVAAAAVEVVEHGVRFAVLPAQGHKTGFFADQRDNRQLVRALAGGRRVLDLFCNSGGFALAAARGGAREVVAADLDEVVLQQAAQNGHLNGARVRWEHGDAFELLRGARAGAHDLIVVDPPKWAAGRGEVDAALERYRDVNRLALAKLAPSGFLLTCSCSGALSEQRFLAALRDAAASAGRDARVLHVGGAGPDHPFALECPEGRYLKAVLLQVR